PGAIVTLDAGKGGIAELNLGGLGFGIVAATLQVHSGGTVGAADHVLFALIDDLGASAIAGNLYLSDIASLTTSGTIQVSGLANFTLGGDFITHAADIHAVAVNLTFAGLGGTQHLDSGNRAFSSVTHSSAGALQLVSHALTITGSLTNADGNF